MLTGKTRRAFDRCRHAVLYHADGIVVDGGALVGAHVKLGQLVGAEMIDI